ncbi:hypothetical protein CLF_106874 [Clonorchis sinensis]|uniref:Uncharacterized protein n=1 Tax=Clonorchis sinensis TaxID=79923 RepID=G7YFV5_CLOSI|nr:hypothetical protein CLF_106874 [Clonorchis sinensis]
MMFPAILLLAYLLTGKHDSLDTARLSKPGQEQTRWRSWIRTTDLRPEVIRTSSSTEVGLSLDEKQRYSRIDHNCPLTSQILRQRTNMKRKYNQAGNYVMSGGICSVAGIPEAYGLVNSDRMATRKNAMSYDMGSTLKTIY